MLAPAHDFFVRKPDGGLKLRMHAGQRRAWRSSKRLVAAIAGTQSGKTVMLPPWLHREIIRCGPGDYLVVSPHFTLMNTKLLPTFTYFFKTLCGLGEYKASTRTFEFSTEGEELTWGRAQDTPTKIFFGHADNPDSLESATAKAAVLDEAGQKEFKLGSWEAILRRLAIHRGRILIGTTPYNLGWLKQKIYDPWKASGCNHPEIDVVQFKSIENPAFPMEEYERAKRDMPAWRFRMFYEGAFERPAGVIYDCFDDRRHLVKPFDIPEAWPRYIGIDFGGANTAAVYFTEEVYDDKRTGKLFAYRVYGPTGGKTARDHAAAILKGEPRPVHIVGGSGSEGQWRKEFQNAGLPVEAPPVMDGSEGKIVEAGIGRVYGAISRDELFVFSNLDGLRDEIATYSRKTDDGGNVLEEIQDKETFHRLDAVRYIISRLKGGSRKKSFFPRGMGIGGVYG